MSTDLTSVSAQMTGEGIAPPAGVAAKGAFEGFFTSVQLDVSQQVSLLRERDTTLVALEWPVSLKSQAQKVSTTLWITFVAVDITDMSANSYNLNLTYLQRSGPTDVSFRQCDLVDAS